MAPGHQTLESGPPQVTSEDNQSSELLSQESFLHKKPSTTGAVDYEYFDVGIGQVANKHTNTV